MKTYRPAPQNAFDTPGEFSLIAGGIWCFSMTRGGALDSQRRLAPALAETDCKLDA
jgi:hypothetical protein